MEKIAKQPEGDKKAAVAKAGGAPAGPPAPPARGGAAAVTGNQAEKQYCDQAEAFLLTQPDYACSLPILGMNVKNPYGNAAAIQKHNYGKTARTILDADTHKRFVTTKDSVSLKPPAAVAGVEGAADESGHAEGHAEASDAQSGGGLAKGNQGPNKGKVDCG